jgi:hypothetical protein
MLRTPSNAGGLIVRRMSHRVADLQSTPTDVEHSIFALAVVASVFSTASKDFFQTFDENIRWFDARLHDLFELQSSFQFLGGCSGGTRLLKSIQKSKNHQRRIFLDNYYRQRCLV